MESGFSMPPSVVKKKHVPRKSSRIDMLRLNIAKMLHLAETIIIIMEIQKKKKEENKTRACFHLWVILERIGLVAILVSNV